MTISGRYSWEETNEVLTVLLPFHGKSVKKLNVFIADCVLKVSHPPFLLDINLKGTVHTTSYKSLLRKDGILVINLQKQSPGLWSELTYSGGSKEVIKKRRHDSIQRREEEIRRQHDNAKSKKLEEERMVTRSQMELDRSEYQHIKKLQLQEKQEAENLLYESIETWSSNDKQNEVHDCVIFDDEPNQTSITKEVISVPPVRDTSCMRFKHTPRVFKTPIRESTVDREREFLLKNRPFLSNNKYFNNDSNADASEVNSFWLKQKGDDFFRGGDYLSAINAYSAAFENDGQLVQALANRSLCYLNLGEMQRCVCDGEEALRIMESEQQLLLSESEIISMKKKLLIRVATAHFQLSHEDLKHCEIALKLLHQATCLSNLDEFLERDLQRGKLILNALTLKLQGDQLLANENVVDAIAAYKEALLIDTTLLSAKVNCATAYLMKGELQACINLCGEVLDLLKIAGSTNDNSPIGTIPLPGTKRRRQIVVATLLKRAEAKSAIGQPVEETLQDLEMAQSICRYLDDGNDIKTDIIRVKKEISIHSGQKKFDNRHLP